MFNCTMRSARFRVGIWCTFLVVALQPSLPAHAQSVSVIQADEVIGGYERSLFKHWIDADGDGCDTRKEVLIAEAITSPTLGSRCALAGGSWKSLYDGKKVTNSSMLDIDHLVPLAEAWRSGAWAWTAEQRMAFANDLSEPRALIAVTASTNRAKGDSDVKEWLPEQNRCDYVQAWVTVKLRYALTFDSGEIRVLKGFFNECKNLVIRTSVLPGFSVTLRDQNSEYSTIVLESLAEVSALPIPAALVKVRLYGPCLQLGLKSRTESGQIVTCKRIPSDAKLKWRK